MDSPKAEWNMRGTRPEAQRILRPRLMKAILQPLKKAQFKNKVEDSWSEIQTDCSRLKKLNSYSKEQGLSIREFDLRRSGPVNEV